MASVLADVLGSYDWWNDGALHDEQQEMMKDL